MNFCARKGIGYFEMHHSMFLSGEDADIPDVESERLKINAMKLTRQRAVKQVKKMVKLVDEIGETAVQSMVSGEQMRTKTPLGAQMLMTK